MYTYLNNEHKPMIVHAMVRVFTYKGKYLDGPAIRDLKELIFAI